MDSFKHSIEFKRCIQELIKVANDSSISREVVEITSLKLEENSNVGREILYLGSYNSIVEFYR